ncbi:MAG: 5'(3')-deoxyribonucleotidase [Chitinophagaceae bacterium]|uniref:5' nucleotidase, NT5C type n=1 Tax=unclassified Paraflavitalea TaxID=2798305 RepID=UPI003D33C24D|nr:5'(3')-deoxyribonucleotidase [Chitinophagaceae bacterium]
MKKRIIVDMDEVMADVLGAMELWYKERYAAPIDYDRMKEGSLVKGFPEEVQPIMRQRLFEPGFFRHLPVMANSQEVLKAINDKYELFIVSAATEFPNSLKDKMEWLNDHFPFISWRQLVLCGDKKLVTGDVMIDDHGRNLVHFPGEKWLYHAPHNVLVTEYERVMDWEEIGKRLL